LETSVLNEALFEFAAWVRELPGSNELQGSLYMYAWVETTHVLALAVFLGMLLLIDLRMLGWCLTAVPASRIAARLDRLMMLGFAAMIITGLLLFYASPLRTTQSIWFRIKVVLLIAAGINAMLFRRRMHGAVHSWDADRVPPQNIRATAGLSLALWVGVIITGRCIAYNWFDCGQPQSAFINWAAGCLADAVAAE
jgi:uncharacterized membrane protein